MTFKYSKKLDELVGVNVLVCLLTQYDDKFKFLPKNLPAMDARQKPSMQ